MSGRRRSLRSILRSWGIVLTIVGTTRVPLPQADYHAVRHHHGPGEVCPYHDHLLRCHADDSSRGDGATLHWHWLLPSSGWSDESLPDDGPGPHAHAHGVAVVPIALDRDHGPDVVPGASARVAPRPAAPPLDMLAFDPGAKMAPRAVLGFMRRPIAFGAALAPQPLTSLLQRWTC